MDEQIKVLIRKDGLGWQAPSIHRYPNERGLQELLKETASLIPGVGDAVIIDELAIAGAGSLDLFAVEPDGTLTLVECKLAANAEVRRAVVGQIASYASGLWKATYEDVDDAFRARGGLSLQEAIGGIATDEWNPEEFRRAVVDNLAAGRFRLVIAVDSITDELKRIVEFLNAHTNADIEILALEVGYVAEGDTEVLLPVTHGQESVRLKGASPSNRKRWRVEDVFDSLNELSSPQVSAAIRQLGERFGELGGYWQTGGASYPTMSLYVEVGPTGTRRSLVAIYADPSGPTAPRISINFGSLRKEFDQGTLESILSALESCDPIKTHAARVRADNFGSYPTIPLEAFVASRGPEVLYEVVAPHIDASPELDRDGEGLKAPILMETRELGFQTQHE
jgi:hypothetical protein